MADRRAIALGLGVSLGLLLSVVLSYYPVNPVVTVLILAPILALFLYGLLASPPA